MKRLSPLPLENDINNSKNILLYDINIELINKYIFAILKEKGVCARYVGVD